LLCIPEFIHFLKLKIKSTLRSIVPRGVRCTLPKGQLKLFHIYPVNMVNSKKE
jgi:hypothetical protein